MRKSDGILLTEMGMYTASDALRSFKVINENFKKIIYELENANYVVEAGSYDKKTFDRFLYRKIIDRYASEYLYSIFDDRFITWLKSEKGFTDTEDDYVTVEREGVSIALVSMDDADYVEYKTNNDNAFKSLATEYAEKMHAFDNYMLNLKYGDLIPFNDAKDFYCIMNNIYGYLYHKIHNPILLMFPHNIEATRVYQFMASHTFTTDEYEYDEDTLEQASEVEREQMADSLMAGGSDPYGDAEYARNEFLNRHPPKRR